MSDSLKAQNILLKGWRGGREERVTKGGPCVLPELQRPAGNERGWQNFRVKFSVKILTSSR